MARLDQGLVQDRIAGDVEQLVVVAVAEARAHLLRAGPVAQRQMQHLMRSEAHLLMRRQGLEPRAVEDRPSVRPGRLIALVAVAVGAPERQRAERRILFREASQRRSGATGMAGGHSRPIACRSLA